MFAQNFENTVPLSPSFQSCCWEIQCHALSWTFVHGMFGVFFLKIFRIFSLSLVFWNSTDTPWCGSFYHLFYWLLSGIYIPSVLGHVLVFLLWSLPSCFFLHSLFLELLLLDVWVLQLILQFSHLFSSVVYFFILLFCFLEYFVSFYFLILPTEIFILTLAIFNFPGLFSSLLTLDPSKFLYFLSVCLFFGSLL